ncbi:S49 family peptidase [Hyphococcus sp.]|uniref:S49 family peptidase n=1 Tax=Hyphococcus sp. TaxID=2038636 RepID=UPI002083C2EA|nr:MAG: hypothetical protein DHS20C04_31380 [Marinicaulis sp.]
MIDLALFKKMLRLSASNLWAMDLTERGVSILLSWEDDQLVAIAGGESLYDGARTRIIDGVAVIPVMGPLMRSAGYGGAYGLIIKDLAFARSDDRVHSILLSIESPGGMVVGCDECAAAIAEASAEKPTAAHIEGIGASAAYWLASQTNEIFAAKTAVVGSVGAMASGMELSGILERFGAVKTEVRSTQSPQKNPPAGSPERAEQLQSIIDEAAQAFIDDVARGRGVTVGTVLTKYGQGAIMSASAALAAGMIDQVATLNEALTVLASRRISGNGPDAAAGRAIQKENIAMDWNTVDAAGLNANRPELVEAIVAAAVAEAQKTALAEGAAAERARIAGLQENCLPGYEAELSTAIGDGTSPETFAASIIKAEKAKGGAHIAAREAAEKDGAPADAAAPESTAAADDTKATNHESAEKIANAKWENLGASGQAKEVSKDVFVANEMADLGFPKHTRAAA